MSSEDEALAPRLRNRAGHYDLLGETYAKFEFFEHGWNPYSRFLDVDKVDLVLRRVVDGRRVYRRPPETGEDLLWRLDALRLNELVAGIHRPVTTVELSVDLGIDL